MNEFDLKAAGWDSNPMHKKRSEAVASHIRKLIPLNPAMKALEFGAGTGITSLLLADSLNHITMMDNSSAMVEMMKEKIKKTGVRNLTPLYFDLEKNDFPPEKFDLIFTQMVLHHVADIDRIIEKFSLLLLSGGYIALSDLYPEDGSFHGDGFNGHKGFDPEYLARVLKRHGFINPVHMPCFTIDKQIAGDRMKGFEIFIITAQKFN